MRKCWEWVKWVFVKRLRKNIFAEKIFINDLKVWREDTEWIFSEKPKKENFLLRVECEKNSWPKIKTSNNFGARRQEWEIWFSLDSFKDSGELSILNHREIKKRTGIIFIWFLYCFEFWRLSLPKEKKYKKNFRTQRNKRMSPVFEYFNVSMFH